jgi:peroxiredoxin Q/BCP
MKVPKGEKAPDFCLLDKDSRSICLKDFRGKWVVLYFYPRDNTKGCTLEALNFTENLQDFEALNAAVIGISPDSVKGHSNFAKTHQLKITLLSDPDHSVLNQFGVWQLKKLYGKKYYGVIRSTYIIDPEGVTAHVWKNVRVKNHVNAVKEKLQKLQKKE